MYQCLEENSGKGTDSLLRGQMSYPCCSINDNVTKYKCSSSEPDEDRQGLWWRPGAWDIDVEIEAVLISLGEVRGSGTEAHHLVTCPPV